MANQVDLVSYLRKQGVELIKDGKEYRLKDNHSVTIRGCKWFEHNGQYGGMAINFLKEFYDMNFPEAVHTLLKDQDVKLDIERKEEKEQVPFRLPERSKTMRRLFAYLIKERCIEQTVIKEFVELHDIYEAEPYHEIVFVGRNETGDAVSAQKKSTGHGKFAITVAGSDPNYMFRYQGYDTHLYIFEAALDMMSWMSEHDDWKQHHFIGNHGVSEHAILRYLENHSITHIHIATDHDLAGMYACQRLTDIILEKYPNMKICRELSAYKDFNEDRKAKFGKEVKPAIESIGIPYVLQLKHTLPSIKGTSKELLTAYMDSGLMDDTEPSLLHMEEILGRCIYLYAESKEDEDQEGEDIHDEIWRSFQAYRCIGTMKQQKTRIKKSIHHLKQLLYARKQVSEEVMLDQAYKGLAHQIMGAIVRLQDETLYPSQGLNQEQVYE